MIDFITIFTLFHTDSHLRNSRATTSVLVNIRHFIFIKNFANIPQLYMVGKSVSDHFSSVQGRSFSSNNFCNRPSEKKIKSRKEHGEDMISDSHLRRTDIQHLNRPILLVIIFLLFH